MKKIVILLTPIVIIALALGCSKDHDAPTFDVYKKAASPLNVEATYDTVNDAVNITWEMADTSGVIDYMIVVSDSSVFADGTIKDFPTNLDVNSLVQPYASTYDAATFIEADVDSIIMYYTVSAVFDNVTFNNYIGPRAIVDSALVLRK